MINYLFKCLFPGLVLFGLLLGCDNRGSVNNSKPPVTFSADLNVVRDYTQGRDIAQARFLRNGVPYTEAQISISGDNLVSVGNGNYFAESPALSLLARSNQVTFSSPDDNYTETIVIDMPDSFGIAAINPRDNQGAGDVQVAWTRPAGASKVILVVVSRNYPADDTSPLMLVLGSDVTNFTIPDTTFEDFSGFPIAGVYYVHLAAFNQGFGEFPGLSFPLPIGLPQRILTNPTGFARNGTVAPVDSIIVLP